MGARHASLLLTFCALAGPAVAGTVLYDFEVASEGPAWHDERGTANRNLPVTRVERFATSGRTALCFKSPKYQAGLAEWPAVESDLRVTDWSAYDRLVWDVTNPTAYPQKLYVFLTDAAHATRDGLMYPMDLPPYSYHGATIDLARLKAHGLALDKMHHLHWFTERPVGDMEVYLDQVALLKPGEARPEPPAEYLRQFGALQNQNLSAMRQSLAEASARLAARAGGQPAILDWVRRQVAGCEAEVDRLAELIRTGSREVLRVDQISRHIEQSIARLDSLVDLRLSFERERTKVQVDRNLRNDVVVGFASSMEKVLPRGAAPKLRMNRRAYLSLARNEKESLQVVVLPCEAAARRVQVRVSDLAGQAGAVLPASRIDAAPVGYVETKAIPPYGSSHVGWWPDPILFHQTSADVAAGDAQSFWVRVRAPKDQAAGHYQGKLEVLADGRPLYAFDLAVEVYPFAVPSRSPLDMAITWWPNDFGPDGKGGWREAPYHDPSWQQHKLEWADFLADYYITMDSLYSYANCGPDFTVLTHLHQQGRLGRFNLGYYAAMPDKPAEQDAWKADIRKRITPLYQKAKELGLLDHAYIYGCDENPAELFPAVERAAAFLKQEYPGAFVLTTTYDHSFGTSSPLKSMDGFCPLTPSYKLDLAQRVRATGKQVWWYICCGPHHPHANMFVEYPAIDARVLMGAQTAKYRPDGFLYYQTALWGGDPIKTGPFTNWEPRSWTTYHGDGSWTCVREGGHPVATIRLENFRDGLEDYAYARLLERLVRQVEASPQAAAKAAWLAEAKRLLAVPEAVVTSMTQYTSDPAAIYRWRRGLAEAIMRAGVAVDDQP